MFKFERAFTVEEIDNLKSKMKNILYKKINEENVSEWVDKLISRYDGDISFGDNRWVGIKLVFATPHEILMSARFKAVIDRYALQTGENKKFYVITNYHRYVACYDLQTNALVYDNDCYGKTDGGILGRMLTENANKKAKEDLDNKTKDSYKYLDENIALSLQSKEDSPFNVKIKLKSQGGGYRTIRTDGKYCDYDCSFRLGMTQFNTYEFSKCLYANEDLKQIDNKNIRCQKCTEKVRKEQIKELSA